VNGEGREVDEVTDVGVPAYWLWVTGPQYYLGSGGSDRVDLEPADEYVPDGWWTCHRDTRKGDLIMLYRKKPKMDIAYLFQARSNASSLLHDTSAEPGWKYGCDYDVIEPAALRTTPLVRAPSLLISGVVTRGFGDDMRRVGGVRA